MKTYLTLLTSFLCLSGLVRPLWADSLPKNYAQGAKATVSDQENKIYCASKLVDGIVNRTAVSGEQSRWGSAERRNLINDVWTGRDLWVEIDLGKKVQGIQDIQIDWEFAKTLDLTLSVSDDSLVWRKVWEQAGQLPTSVSQIISLDKPVDGRYVKLTIGSFQKQAWPTVSIYEIGVFTEKLPMTLGRALDLLTPATIDVSGDQLTHELPASITAKMIASTFEQIIALDGKIRHPLNDKTTLVTFELSKDGQTITSQPIPLVVKGTFTDPATQAKPAVIPALQEWESTEKGQWKPTDTTIISCADVDSLKSRMRIFAYELCNLMQVNVQIVPRSNIADIRVILSPEVAHKLGPEGYELEINQVVTIKAATEQAAFWATRSIMQILASKGALPYGRAIDYPQYPVRGFMYDVGRKPTTIQMIQDVMQVMAWYKMNDLQLHLNDNYIWLHEYTKIANDKQASLENKKAAIAEVLKQNPSSFRLESVVEGKNGVKLTSKDASFSKADFGALLDQAKLYGVSIVPEIDVPGHAMSLVAVRPELMYRGGVHKPHDVERVAMLDASHEVYDPKTGSTYLDETLNFAQGIFDEYLTGENPVFRDSVVHIGTDEYYGHPEDYRAFADAMLKFMIKRGRTPRLWGSLRAKQGKTPVISKGVQMHIWSLYWQAPQPAIDLGYDIINILDRDVYVVPNGQGNIGAYGDDISRQHLYSDKWQPHIFANQRVAPGHPKLLGAQWALWCDNAWRRDTGLQDLDLFDRIAANCSVIAEKTWATGQDASFDAFTALTAKIGLPRHLNAADVYKPNYTLTFDCMRKGEGNQEQILFKGHTATIRAVDSTTGKMGLRRNSWDYVFDYTLPLDKWVSIKIVANGRQTTLFVDGKKIGSPKRLLFPDACKYYSLYLTKPIQVDPSFKGEIKNLEIK